MDDLARLITDVVVAAATTALVHIGVPADDVELRNAKPQSERVIKRSRVYDRPAPVVRPAS